MYSIITLSAIAILTAFFFINGIYEAKKAEKKNS